MKSAILLFDKKDRSTGGRRRCTDEPLGEVVLYPCPESFKLGFGHAVQWSKGWNEVRFQGDLVVVHAVWRKFVSNSLLEHPEEVMIIVGYESLDMFISVITLIRARIDPI